MKRRGLFSASLLTLFSSSAPAWARLRKPPRPHRMDRAEETSLTGSPIGSRSRRAVLTWTGERGRSLRSQPSGEASFRRARARPLPGSRRGVIGDEGETDETASILAREITGGKEPDPTRNERATRLWRRGRLLGLGNLAASQPAR